jgi:hypothetical protein
VLAATVNHKGSRGQLRGDKLSPQGKTLSDEITKKQSSRAQQLFRIPWDELEARVDQKTDQNEKARGHYTRLHPTTPANRCPQV